MTPKKLKKNKSSSSNDIHSDVLAAADSKQKKIVKLEKKLKAMEKVIEKWDKKDVDLNFELEGDDEVNTAYLVKSRTVDRYMKYWKELCALTKFSPVNTGRPIHRRIATDNVTRFPEVNETFFKVINSRINKDVYYFPDFPEVLSIVENVKETKNLAVGDYEIRQMAKDLFERIVAVLKKRRRKDFCLVLPAKEINDPADDDEALAKKLDENKSKGKREDDVIREYVEKQAEEIDLGDDDSVTEDEMNNDADSDVQILSDVDVPETTDTPMEISQDNNSDTVDLDSDSDIEILSENISCPT